MKLEMRSINSHLHILFLKKILLWTQLLVWHKNTKKALKLQEAVLPIDTVQRSPGLTTTLLRANQWARSEMVALFITKHLTPIHKNISSTWNHFWVSWQSERQRKCTRCELQKEDQNWLDRKPVTLDIRIQSKAIYPIRPFWNLDIRLVYGSSYVAWKKNELKNTRDRAELKCHQPVTW